MFIANKSQRPRFLKESQVFYNRIIETSCFFFPAKGMLYRLNEVFLPVQLARMLQSGTRLFPVITNVVYDSSSDHLCWKYSNRNFLSLITIPFIYPNNLKVAFMLIVILPITYYFLLSLLLLYRLSGRILRHLI